MAEVLAAGAGLPAPPIPVQLGGGSDPRGLFPVKQATVTTRLPEGHEPNRNLVLQGLRLDA
jgi:hypothetical protein